MDFERAKEFIRENLSELASDLIYWNKKGMLPDETKFREVAKLLEENNIPPSHSLATAERFVQDEALKCVAYGRTP